MPAPKILIVEDDLNLSSLLKTTFERDGFEVIQAFDGAEAYSSLTSMKTPPNIILLDIVMPTMNGFEFMDKLRTTASDYSQLPVMALTSLAQKEDFEKMMSKGTVAYLIKSDYEPHQILGKVKDMLRRLA